MYQNKQNLYNIKQKGTMIILWRRWKPRFQRMHDVMLGSAVFWSRFYLVKAICMVMWYWNCTPSISGIPPINQIKYCSEGLLFLFNLKKMEYFSDVIF